MSWKNISQTISAEDGDIRLDRWFKRYFASLQHSVLEKLLRKGDIRIDGKKAKSADRLSAGSEISYPEFLLKEQETVHKAPKRISPEDNKFVQNLILYKDDKVVIINKPHGFPVQGGSKVKKSIDDLLPALSFEAKETPKLVHRLDKDTSGVLLLARSSKVAAQLAKAFAVRDMEKTYIALVCGAPENNKGVIDSRLLKAAHGAGAYERVAVDDEEGKYAKTEYQVLDKIGKKFALVQLKPLTGRTHQLRVHMQSIGCPIVGDEKYGGVQHQGAALDIQQKLHLHARKIVIPASVFGKILEVNAPLPAHMLESIKVLGLN